MKVGKQGGAQMLLHLGYEKILGDAVGSKKKKASNVPYACAFQAGFYVQKCASGEMERFICLLVIQLCEHMAMR